MAFLPGEGSAKESVDDGESLGKRVHAPADSDQLRVVVLSGELGRFHAPCKSTSGTRHLVRGDLLSVARAPEDEAAAAWIGDDAAGGIDAERGVVVDGVVIEGPTVDGLVPGGREVFDDLILELETGMVCTQVYAHA